MHIQDMGASWTALFWIGDRSPFKEKALASWRPGDVCKAVSIEAMRMRLGDVPEWAKPLHSRFDVE